MAGIPPNTVPHVRGGGLVHVSANVDPTAYVAKNEDNPLAIVVKERCYVGRGSYIGFRVFLEHDTIVGEETKIGVTAGETVTIGHSAQIGSNCWIKDNVGIECVIGDDCVIDAPIGMQAIIGEGNVITVPVAFGVVVPPVGGGGSVSNVTTEIKANYLINGSMYWRQWISSGGGPSVVTNTTTKTYQMDRWGVSGSGIHTDRGQTVVSPIAGISEPQHATYDIFPQITPSKLMVCQIVPQDLAVKLRSKTVTLQMKFCRAGGALINIKMALLEWSGTQDGIPNAYYTSLGGANVDPTFAAGLTAALPTKVTGGTIVGNAVRMPTTTVNVFTNLAATFTVSPGVRNLVAVFWTDELLPADGFLRVGEAGLFEAADVVQWQVIDPALEGIRVKRFYAKTFGNFGGTFGLGDPGYLKAPAIKAGAVATAVGFHWRFPVEMYKTPTITLINVDSGATGAGAVRDMTAAANCTAAVTSDITALAVSVGYTGASATAIGNVMAVGIAANAEL